jgi:hypothetical protein
MRLDDRTITTFLDETEMYHCCINLSAALTRIIRVLQGIITKLKSRRQLNFLLAIIKQDELQGWALEQNRKVDEQFQTMMVSHISCPGRLPYLASDANSRYNWASSNGDEGQTST